MCHHGGDFRANSGVRRFTCQLPSISSVTKPCYHWLLRSRSKSSTQATQRQQLIGSVSGTTCLENASVPYHRQRPLNATSSSLLAACEFVNFIQFTRDTGERAVRGEVNDNGKSFLADFIDPVSGGNISPRGVMVPRSNVGTPLIM